MTKEELLDRIYAQQDALSILPILELRKDNVMAYLTELARYVAELE